MRSIRDIKRIIADTDKYSDDYLNRMDLLRNVGILDDLNLMYVNMHTLSDTIALCLKGDDAH